MDWLRYIRCAVNPIHSSEYELVPTDPELVRSTVQTRRRPSLSWFVRSFSIRRLLLLLLVLFLLLVVVILAQGIPPDFHDIRDFERALPQHNLSDPALDDARFLRFPDHLWGHGLNNVLQQA